MSISNASTGTKDIDNTNHNLKKTNDIDQVLRDLRSNNPSDLNFAILILTQ